jgi:hypothetical protein
MHREQKDVPIVPIPTVIGTIREERRNINKVVKEDLKKIHLSLPHTLPAI